MNSQSPLASSLSIEENLLIRTACRTLEAECRKAPFRFWGKVLGTQNDYYLVQSTTLHPFQIPTTYYSRDARIWQTLPSVSMALRKKAPRLNGMFTGDPTFTTNFVEYRYAGDAYYEPTTTTIKEEERLAYLVHCIGGEATIFPKKAIGLDERGYLVRNPTYEGMSYDECHDFNNYVLYKPSNSPPKNGLGYDEIGIEDPAHNILVPLIETLPVDNPSANGSWIFFDAFEESCVVMENTQWPGFYFWQNIDNANFDSCYIGCGEKNLDVPFIYGAAEDQEWVINVGIVPDYDYKAPPEEALKAAEEAFLAEEERREKLLPPLPVKEVPPADGSLAEGESDGVSKGETDETSGGGDTTEGETTDGEPPSTEVTDASENEGEEA